MREIDADYLLSYFEILEDRMIEFQKIIPFCHEHKIVHSPVLAGIINESCNLLDSLFYAYYKGEVSKPKIKNYKDFYNPSLLLHETKTLLFVTPPEYCEPFQEWSIENTPLEWWSIHNKLKHERIEYIKEGKYISAIHALCALHQSIVKIAEHGYDPVLGEVLLRHGWIKSDYSPHLLYENFKTGSWGNDHALIETKLFATPLGIENFPNKVSDISPGIYDHNSRLRYFLAL